MSLWRDPWPWQPTVQCAATASPLPCERCDWTAAEWDAWRSGVSRQAAQRNRPLPTHCVAEGDDARDLYQARGEATELAKLLDGDAHPEMAYDRARTSVPELRVRRPIVAVAEPLTAKGRREEFQPEENTAPTGGGCRYI